ncbi:MAG: hypothetical protein WCN85_11580 [Burkholderiales bacterium]
MSSTAFAGTNDVSKSDGPGRCCPLDYRYDPRALREAPALNCDVLWVLGGLYGNTEALACLQSLIDRESQGRVEVVVNGDFHWFDVDPDEFSAIEAGVGRWHAMRGNVETELAREPSADGTDAGCGCAYPDSVDQADVDRSNAMIGRLRETARGLRAGAALGALPMLRRAQVGALRVGCVHGDDQSLSGWRLAHDALQSSRAQGLPAAFDAAQIDLMACSHTCLPVAETFVWPIDGRTLAVINNGAAGMANFTGSTHGVVTRIAIDGLPPPAGARVLYRTHLTGCEVSAIAVDFDAARYLERFDRQWPAGSPGAVSYRDRLARGPAYRLVAAARGSFRLA